MHTSLALSPAMDCDNRPGPAEWAFFMFRRLHALFLARSSALLEAVLVVAFFTAVAAYATWPVAVHPLGGFYGFGNDNLGGIWAYGWLHDAYFGPQSTSFTHDLQAPFGWEIPQQAFQPADKAFALVFGGPGEGLAAYNAQIFLSFVLAGCTMYVLARYLTGSPLAAAVAGFVFTFSPFHLAQGMQYGALASIEWLPLFLLALLVCLRRPSLRQAVLVGGAFALVTATSYYHAWFLAWFALIVVAVYGVRLALRARRAHELSGAAVQRFVWLAASRASVALLVTVVLLAPFLIVSAQARSEHAASLSHPLTEAIRYSGRPWMLFVPPHDNPVFGPHVRSWVQVHLYENPLIDQSIYIGYTVLALALFGLFAGWVAQRAPAFTRFVLATGAVTGLVFVMGPYLPLDRDYWRLWAEPDTTRHLPSLGRLMFELAPEFRFFSRAFILVSLCLAALAALGFARLERRFRTPAPRIVLAVAAIGLVGLEFTNAPPHVWAAEKQPPWVGAVRGLPEGASVVDYPIASLNSPRSLYYLFWQRRHRHPTFNPIESSSSQQLAAQIGSPDDVATGRALHNAGIDYAIVHTDLPPQTRPPYQPALPDDSMPPNAGAINPWLQPVGRTRDAVVYRILDRPRRATGAVARPTAGFGGVEPEGAGTARWLEAETGTITIYVLGAPRPTSVVLTLSSFAQPRRVAISLDGRRLTSVDVPAGSIESHKLTLGRLGPGTHSLVLRPSPGPQSISATTGTPDTRSVSIRLREPVVIVRPRAARRR
jgi:hypothetical protein